MPIKIVVIMKIVEDTTIRDINIFARMGDGIVLI
jgi:hypothetical protein